jgi:biotin/methionine sulfoxide reductase
LEKFRTATQWGIYDMLVSDGQIVGVENIPEDPAPSPLGDALVDGVQHPLRIKEPAIRRGWLENEDRSRHKRGADEFVTVSWDEALELAAGEIKRVAEEQGNKSIFAGSYGWASAGRFNHAQSQLHRFINMAGGSTRAMNSYSTAAAQVILPHVVAPWGQMELEQTNWDEITEHTEVMIVFGGVPLRNTQVAYGGITEHQSTPGFHGAQAKGVRFINVSPVRRDVVDAEDWIAPRPGTDVALMLGMAFELETNDLADKSFLASHCVGYESFRTYLLGIDDGQPKTPEWASHICDVPAIKISELAHLAANNRTLISAAWSLQRAHHGEQPYWMVVTLAAMLGNIGRTGEGFGFGYGAEGFVGSAWRRFNWATLSKGRNPTGFAIPVARITDMLLSPGETIDYNGMAIEYPEIKLIYWAGGNPFHHHQDLNRLSGAWRKPDTVIVNEPWWTPVAKWADIVFPATTQLEREDICASSHDPYAHVMETVIPPQHNARSDHHIFAGLAEKLGFAATFTEGKNDRQWLADMWQRSQERAVKEGFELPSFDEFWSKKQHKIPESAPREPWLSGFRSDPHVHRLTTPSGKIELFSEVIAGFEYEDCVGHAAWFEPFERLGGAGAENYPFALLSPQPERRLHSQLDHSKHSQKGKVAGREPITLHPLAAKQKDIKNGDTVRVFNDRGQCLAGAVLDESIRQDVVALPTGAWFNPTDPMLDQSLELAGNPNVLTRDIGTSKLAQGPSSGTCLVDVELYRP